MEVKSGYVAKEVDRYDKLVAKLTAGLAASRASENVKMVVVTELNSKEILGIQMPRSTYRKAMFRRLGAKIQFSKQSDTVKYQ